MVTGAGLPRPCDLGNVMKPAGYTLLLTLLMPDMVQAHGYVFGELEILHPTIVIVAPKGSFDCACAHVKIINHGGETEYFLGAEIAIARRTKLFHFTEHSTGVSEPSAVPIEPGKAIDLHRREWCLFLSNINQELEADIGAYAARLMFRRAGIIDIEFVVDPISR